MLLSALGAIGAASVYAPSPASAATCTHTYQYDVNTDLPGWSEVEWLSNSCGYHFRGVSQCYGGKPTHHITEYGGYVVSTGLYSRATCPAGEPIIDHAGYQIEQAGGGGDPIVWYWPSTSRGSVSAGHSRRAGR
jgi:hypothetical protein